MGARWGLQGQEVGREDGPRAVGEGLGPQDSLLTRGGWQEGDKVEPFWT